MSHLHHLHFNKTLLIVIVISFILRLIGLNQMGRTWDEYAYIGDGYQLVTHYLHGDWQDPIWQQITDHPPLTRYLFGLTGMFSIAGYQNDKPVYQYDWTAPRLLSALLGSITIGAIYLIGLELTTPPTALIAALTASSIPFVVGLAQLATLDTLVLTGWSLTFYVFLRHLKHPTITNATILGLSLGLTLLTKYTNILIIPVLFLTWYLLKPSPPLRVKTLLITALTAVLVCLLLWPPLMLHPKLLAVNILNRTTSATHAPAETFMGSYQAVPPTYYLVYLLISLPPALLLAVAFGFIKLSTHNRHLLMILLCWLIVPLLLSFYPIRRNGLRYVIPVVIPLSLLAGYALTQISRDVSRLLIPAYFITLIFALARVYPYYLDYFNLFVGGPSTVYHQRLFNLGWWGEGQRAGMFWLAGHIRRGETLGFAVAPLYVAPSISGIRTGRYDLQPNYPFAYLMFNTLWEMDQRFDYTTLASDYRQVYQVTTAGAPLVRIYKRITPIPSATPSAIPSN